jgi:hypothetical protein
MPAPAPYPCCRRIAGVDSVVRLAALRVLAVEPQRDAAIAPASGSDCRSTGQSGLVEMKVVVGNLCRRRPHPARRIDRVQRRGGYRGIDRRSALEPIDRDVAGADVVDERDRAT